MGKTLELSITVNDLARYVARQCSSIFPDIKIDSQDILSQVSLSIQKVENCFKKVKLPYYNQKNNSLFNHLNSDHYCVFLYHLSRTIYVDKGDEAISSKIFQLNKIFHGIDAFYKIKLPDVFIVVHPIGTVLGNAKYGEKMVFYQGVTVGSTHLGKYPEFQGENILYSNSSVVGDCRIKSNVIFGANSSLINTNVDESLTVIGSYPNNRFIQSKPIINQIFS